ncbi:MAG: substrate-binding domain-containing protein [Treponema sp.]|jgi:ribose transport system substrate-binding protein|nr:substrate-binding domain-containing protein [Treponema sp.]
MTANPDLTGIYGCNEGAQWARKTPLSRLGNAIQIKFVGFDWSADTKSLIERGILLATMVQNPYEMGYQGLQAGVDLLAGKPVQQNVDISVTVAIQVNINSIK